MVVVALGYSGAHTLKKTRCDRKAKSRELRRFCKLNRIETGAADTLIELARTSRYSGIRGRVAVAYELRAELDGRTIHYPKEMSGYQFMLGHIAHARLERDRKQVPWLQRDEPSPPCAHPYDLGKHVFCVLEPERRDLVAVRIGKTKDIWFLVSRDDYQRRSGSADAPE